MCWRWLFVALLLCASSTSFAQNAADFSGAYLRNNSPSDLHSSPGKSTTQQIALAQEMLKTLDEGSPLVLAVTRTTDGVKITEIQNGVRSANQYYFRTGKSSKTHAAGIHEVSRARIKKDTLTIDYAMEEAMPWGATITEQVHERWNLSPDSRTLTLHSTRNGTQTFTRQASLESALARADQVSLMNRCVCLRLPPGSQLPAEYKGGAALGFTVYRQLNRCIILDAGISGDLFKGLQRADSANGTKFLKSGRAIAIFPDDVFLEISFRANSCLESWDSLGFGDAPLPAEMFSLRFQVKWEGSSTRELGELPSELLSEPWPEQREPEHFYRIQLTAKGVPLTDNLEVRILTSAGRQIGCIRGHI